MKIELIVMAVLAIGYLHGCGGGDAKAATETAAMPGSPVVAAAPTTGGQRR